MLVPNDTADTYDATDAMMRHPLLERAELERADFVAAMSRAVTSVNIVTTDGEAGRLGLTVSAVTSVSADPPLILACVNRRNPLADAVRRNGVLCVNLLAGCHASLSDIFAGRSERQRGFDFDNAEWRPTRSGAAELIGAVASFDCVLEHAIDAGTHTIFVGRVVAVSTNGAAPLAYCDRTYCTTSALSCAP